MISEILIFRYNKVIKWAYILSMQFSANLLNARINIHEYENVTNNKQIMIIYLIQRDFRHVIW